MLCIVRAINPEREYTWHVGEPKPTARDVSNNTSKTTGNPFEDVCQVYADGHELEHIRATFRNLPDVPEAHSVLWRNDNAQFIYDHLPSFSDRVKSR